MMELIKKYESIETSLDLKRNGLTLADYRALYGCLVDLHNGTPVYVITKSIAQWFKKNGAKVKTVACGWHIEL